MSYLIISTALLLLIIGPIAFVRNRRATAAPSAPPAGWMRLYRLRGLLMAALGVGAYVFTYSTTGNDGQPWRVVGFPLPAAAFDSRGADYVGPLTLPFTLLNVVMWAMLPDIGLFVWRQVSLKRGRTIGA